METQYAESREDLAQVLAVLIASKGRIERREWQAMANADAYHRIGVSQVRFAELVEGCLRDLGANLLDHQWLSAGNVAQIDRVLARVTDREQRLLVCALAADVLKTRDHMSGYDGLVLDHAMARWHLTDALLFGGATASEGAQVCSHVTELGRSTH